MENKIKHWENGVRGSFHAIVVVVRTRRLHELIFFEQFPTICRRGGYQPPET